MFNLNSFDTQQIGITEFTDSKKRLHTVRHSIIKTDVQKHELEKSIAEDLYAIFNNRRLNAM